MFGRKKYGDAENYLKLSLKIKLSLLPDNHIHLFATYNSLGCLYKEKEEFLYAKTNFKKAISVCSNSESSVKELISAKVNLSTVYIVFGEISKAETILREIIDLYEKSENIIEYWLTHCYYNIGCLFYLIFKLNKNLLLFDDAQPHISKEAVSKLESSPLRMSDHIENDVIYYLSKALDLFEDREVLSIMRGYYYIGKIYISVCDFKSAESSFRKSLEKCIKIYGVDSLDTARVKYMPGFCLQSQNELVEAEYLYNEALRVFKRNTQEDSHELADVYNNLSIILLYNGMCETAYEYAYKALLIRREKVGIENIETLRSCFNLAQACRAKGEYEKAVRYYEMVYDFLINHDGVEGAMLYFSSLMLGNIYDCVYCSNKATNYYLAALKTAYILYGKDSETTRDCCVRLIDYCDRNGLDCEQLVGRL